VLLQAHALAIAEHLMGLETLVVLEFRDFEAGDAEVLTAEEYLRVDCAIVRLWGESCKALRRIFLRVCKRLCRCSELTKTV
jgi:hypothetical protein